MGSYNQMSVVMMLFFQYLQWRKKSSYVKDWPMLHERPTNFCSRWAISFFLHILRFHNTRVSKAIINLRFCHCRHFRTIPTPYGTRPLALWLHSTDCSCTLIAKTLGSTLIRHFRIGLMFNWCRSGGLSYMGTHALPRNWYAPLSIICD